MGEKMPQKAVFENFGKLLSLSDVEDSDGGKYMCKAQNSAGVAVHYFDVIVEGAFKSRPFVRLSGSGARFDSSPCRAPEVADGASSGRADRDGVRCSHQMLGQWKTATRHYMEEKRRSVYR